MKKIFTQKHLAILVIFLLNAKLSTAQWNGSLTQNNIVCNAASIQANNQAISDGNGGVISAWEDSRNAKSMIYAQRLDKNGITKWTANGIRVSTSDSAQSAHKMVDDGKGGVFIAWVEVGAATYTDIYAQHIDSNGVALWAVRGIAICTSANNQNEISMCKDTSGGFYITWTDNRTTGTTSSDIYIQKVNATGTTQFAAGGLGVNTQPKPQQSSYIIADGWGNALVSYLTYMGNAVAGYDVMVAKIDKAGGVGSWTTNVSSQGGNEGNQRLASDSLGGAYIVWDLGVNVTGYNIYAQRINATGAIQWAAGGIAICNVTGVQVNPEIVADGFGNAIISWADGRNVQYPILYTQRVNKLGVAKWTANGIAVGSVAVNGQQHCSMVANRTGGAVYVFEDTRTASTNGGFHDLFAQQLDSLGTPLWGATSVAISTASNQQDFPKVVAATNGEYIACWDDLRNGASDIYASKIGSNGLLPTNITNISITNKNNTNILNWISENEINVSHFNIQYSTNGRDFISIGQMDAGSKEYHFNHTNYSFVSNNYYRLQIVDKDGKIAYSKIVAIATKTKQQEISIYPTVVNSTATIKLNAAKTANYVVNITDISGKIIIQKTYKIFEGTNALTLDCSALQPNIYFVSVIENNEILATQKIMKQ